jgi:transcriptional regulator with XRE-family HTH domain
LDTFGERLRRYRTAAALSTSDLAYRVGVTEGAIRQLESGRTKSASFTLGLKIAKVLDVDAWLLATGLGDEKTSGRSAESGPIKDRVARLEARMEAIENALVARETRRRPAR